MWRSKSLVSLGLLSTSFLAGCGASVPDETVGAVQQAIDVNADVVISQVYGGGNTGSAVFKNDFVELFNRSAGPVSIENWSVQYASASGTGTFASNGVVVLHGTLQPGQHYLVRLDGGSAGADLPTPDATGSLALAQASGKVALARVATGLTCNSAASCTGANATNLVDLVGFGAANYFEGTAAAPTLTASTAALRGNNGCNDTNQNSVDFTAGAPTPRNSSSAATPCSTGNVAPYVSSTIPANNAGSVAVSANINITFSEAVTASGSWYSINCNSSGNVSATVSGGPSSYTLDPSVDLQPAETCTVTVNAANIVDTQGTAQASNYVFSFTTGAPPGLVSIHTIQGKSHVSPLKGAAVTTRGIVTALASNGYYLQEPSPDADDATSEAIFVFTSSAPGVVVGDDVQVSGTIIEFRPGCSGCTASSDAFANLTTTELGSITATSVLAHAQPLPAPVVIGAAGRQPPTTVIEDDAVGDVEVVAGTFDPSTDGLDFYESLEAMRVQVNDAVAVGRTASFSGGSLELPVLADNGAGASVRTARGGIVVRASDFNPERISLANDLVSALPSANVGDKLPGAIVGVMSYTFANYKLFYTQALPALVSGGITREVTTLPARRAKELDIAAFNVENLDALDPQSKFNDLAATLVNSLKSPDIVALEEAQDDDGATNSGTVGATQTLNKLVTAISTAGGPSYTYRQVNPVNNQDGGEPGGNIRVVFLFRTDRGLTFTDRAGGGSTTANTVVGTGAATSLQFNPGRIDPTNGVFSSSRKPLAGEFEFAGRRFFVIANHFNSKGGDDPLFGRFQPPQLSSETQRTGQATVVKNFVGQLLSASPTAEVVVLGDLNDFEFSAPLNVLKSGGLSDLIEGLPQNERYTYVYQGNSQALDHIMPSSALTAHVVGYDIVHANSEFATQASDHDPSIARISFDRVAPVVTVPSGPITVTASGPSGANVTYSVTANDDQDGSLPVTCTSASGSLFPVGTTSVNCTATDAGGNVSSGSFSVTVNSGSPVPALPFGPLAGLALLLLGIGRRKVANQSA